MGSCRCFYMSFHIFFYGWMIQNLISNGCSHPAMAPWVQHQEDHPELKKGEEFYYLHHAGWLTSITFAQYDARPERAEGRGVGVWPSPGWCPVKSCLGMGCLIETSWSFRSKSRGAPSNPGCSDWNGVCIRCRTDSGRIYEWTYPKGFFPTIPIFRSS